MKQHAGNAEDAKGGGEVEDKEVKRASNLLIKQVSRFTVRLPDPSQLRLSEDAVLHLHRVMDEYNNAYQLGPSLPSTRQRLHQQLHDFFDAFGSHFFRGPVSFGGVFHVRGELVSKDSMSASVAHSAAANATSKAAHISAVEIVVSRARRRAPVSSADDLILTTV